MSNSYHKSKSSRSSAPAAGGLSASAPHCDSSPASLRTNGALPAFDVQRNAASVDASGTSVASAAPSAAAGTDREACAEVAALNGSTMRLQETAAALRGAAKARSGSRGAARGKPARSAAEPSLAPASRSESLEPSALQPGEEPLPGDAAAFVDAVHSQADLQEVGKRLLNSSDEKIVKGVWERMLEMKYGRGAAQPEESQRIVIDVPRPVRD